MNDYEYWTRAKEIKKKNLKWFCGIAGGLAALTLAAGIYMRSPNMPYEHKRNIYSYGIIATDLIFATSFFFSGKEMRQLRKLNEEYEKTRRKKR